MFHVQSFQDVKTVFWQGHFFAGRALFRTSAGRRILDAISRWEFFCRYCKEPIRKVVPNHFDIIFLTSGTKATAAMGGILRQIVSCFRITLQANALRVIFDFKIKTAGLPWRVCCRSISPVSVLLYKLTLYESHTRARF